MTNRYAVRREGGFTLLELMVVIAILAILVALAVPSFNNLILRNRLHAAVQDISSVIDLARNEAIMRSHTVRLTPVNAADWGEGLQVLVDDERDGTSFDDGLVFRSEAIHSGLEVNTAAGHSVSAGYVVFNSLGYLDSPGDTVALIIKTSGCAYSSMMLLRLAPSGELLVTEEECS